MFKQKKDSKLHNNSNLFRNKRGKELHNSNSNLFRNKRGKELHNSNSNLFRNKKAMELQVNFLVILILALVIFGMGIGLAMKTFGQANELKDSLDNQAEQEILSYLNSGKIISVGINRKVMKVGETETFALGLINKYGKEIRYSVKVDETFIAVDSNNDLISESIIRDLGIDSISLWTFERRPPVDTEYFSLVNNEKTAVPLAFRVPPKTPKGLYSFTVRVFYQLINPDQTFDGNDKLFNNQPQKIYIEVK